MILAWFWQDFLARIIRYCKKNGHFPNSATRRDVVERADQVGCVEKNWPTARSNAVVEDQIGCLLQRDPRMERVKGLRSLNVRFVGRYRGLS